MKILSIITICFNCETQVLKTLCCVLQHLTEDVAKKIEYIVIDGKSEDGTVQSAKFYLERMNACGVSTEVISEDDAGIYDAMNKGLRLASGQWIYMLNAGDLLHPECNLVDFVMYLEKTSADIVYGNTLRKSIYFEEEWIPISLEHLNKGMVFCHQSVAIRRDLPEHYYNLHYKLCADYELISRLYVNGRKFEHYNSFLAVYSLDGVSAKGKIVDAYKETYKIKNEYFYLKKNLKVRLEYLCGVCKRRFISLLPEKVRWNITRLKRKLFEQRGY